MADEHVVAVDKKRPVSAPKKPLPPHAWDSHAHVFGPFQAYPLLESRRYDPPLAPVRDYLDMLDNVGFERGVPVHASAYGLDNTCTADALAAAPQRLRGVAVVSPTIDDRSLEKMHALGFRGIRFTVTGARSQAFGGSLDFNDLRAFAPRLRALGWHAQIWAKCDLVVNEATHLADYDIPIIFDHMGYFEPERGVGDAVFQSFRSMLKDGNFWVKMTPVRLCRSDPLYEIVRPFHERLMQDIPDRSVFGTDWPYISLDDNPPDAGHFVDLFDAWTPDETARQKVFVDNPRAFYLGPSAAR